MKVLFLNSTLSPRGGAHRWLISVLASLQGRVQTHLAVGQQHRKMPAHETARVGPWSRIKGLDRRGNRPQGRQGAVRRLAAEIQRQDPQVIQLNDVTDPDLIAAAAQARPTVMMVQDHRFFCPGRGKVDAKNLQCTDPMGDGCQRCFAEPVHGARMLELTRARLVALQQVTRITVLSRYMADELIIAGVDSAKITVLPPFVDFPPVSAPTETSTASHHLLAGRLSPHKGLAVALDAAANSDSGLELPLLIAGAGPMERQLRDVAAGNPERIVFDGWAGRDRLARILNEARSLWLPSLWAEPLGIVGLEALAAGVPVIASEVGGIPEWLEHGVSGLLVPPGSAQALAEAARQLEADPEAARAMGLRGKERVARDFTAEKTIEALIRIYEGVV